MLLRGALLKGGTLWMLLGMMKFRALTHPDFKIPCKSLGRLCLSFCFYLQEETDEVMNQELQGLPQLSNIEWLCDLIFLADVFSSLSNDSSKVPENSYLLCLTVWIHLKEHWNDCKSLILAWTKKDAKLSLCAFVDGSWYLKILLANCFCHPGLTFVHCMILPEWNSKNPLFQYKLATCLLSKENSSIPYH